jgi:hypothetical protein
MSKAPREVYNAIMDAARRGAGLRLTAEEVRALSMDDAVATAAAERAPPDPPAEPRDVGNEWLEYLRNGAAW